MVGIGKCGMDAIIPKNGTTFARIPSAPGWWNAPTTGPGRARSIDWIGEGRERTRFSGEGGRASGRASVPTSRVPGGRASREGERPREPGLSKVVGRPWPPIRCCSFEAEQDRTAISASSRFQASRSDHVQDPRIQVISRKKNSACSQRCPRVCFKDGHDKNFSNECFREASIDGRNLGRPEHSPGTV